MPTVTDKQEQIMKASLDLFIERGFDGTTMPMISKKSKRRSRNHLPLFRQQRGTCQYFVSA
ncbi:TetR/AcrR family transcriptional regulator [Bacillus sp. SL00103]